MKKLVLSGVSLLAIVLIVLCSQSSVVGYRIMKESQQNLIQETLNQMKTSLLSIKNQQGMSPASSKDLDQDVSRYKLFYLLGFIIGLVSWIPAIIVLLGWHIFMFVVSMQIISGQGLTLVMVLPFVLIFFICFLISVICYPFARGLKLAERVVNHTKIEKPLCKVLDKLFYTLDGFFSYFHPFFSLFIIGPLEMLVYFEEIILLSPY